MFDKLVLSKANSDFAVVLKNCGQHLNKFEQREILPYPTSKSSICKYLEI